MQTKLTLRLEHRLIELAKRHAARRGKSVSRIVAEYFTVIAHERDADGDALPPTVRALKGVLGGAQVAESEHRVHLERKYR